jgi:hypothetical protein
MAEFLVRFVFEIIVLGILELVARAGQLITRIVVPLLSTRVLVEPVPGTLVVVQRWHGLHRLTDGTPVIGRPLASMIGLTLLACAAVASLIVARSF